MPYQDGVRCVARVRAAGAGRCRQPAWPIRTWARQARVRLLRESKSQLRPSFWQIQRNPASGASF